MRFPTTHPSLPGEVLDAHPLATLLVDASLRVVHANAAGRSLLGARHDVTLGEALGCVEAAAETCGEGPRCATCVFRAAVERALGGELARARGFVLRTGVRGEPADLHLLAAATPLDAGGVRRAVLALDDVNAIIAPPGMFDVCAGCGRVHDEDGWHPLHRYFEDRLGVEAVALCDACAAGTGRGSPP